MSVLMSSTLFLVSFPRSPFTTRAATPLVDVAPTAIHATAEIHAGHMADSFFRVIWAASATAAPLLASH
jgi:hypothetical protein